MRTILITLGFALTLAAAAPAAAQISPAFEYTATQTLNEGNPYTLGFSFNLSQATTINALGYWSGGNLTSHQVGIWNTSGALLASGTVSAADPLQGHYRYDSIAPLLLGAGDYVIGGQYFNGIFPSNLSGVTTAPGYTWTGDRQLFGGFAFPTVDTGGSYGQNGIALVNFSIGGIAAVPEPGTWAMMLLGFGAIGVSLRRRKPALCALAA